MKKLEDKSELKEMDISRINYKKLTAFLIDTIATYDFKTVEIQSLKKEKIYGLYNSDEKTVYKNSKQDIYEMKKSVIHEILHIYSDKNEFNWDEDTVENLTIKLYRRIYL